MHDIIELLRIENASIAEWLSTKHNSRDGQMTTAYRLNEQQTGPSSSSSTSSSVAAAAAEGAG